MGVIRAEPARMTDWAARSIGAAWRAFDLQLAAYAALLATLGLVMAYTNSVEQGQAVLAGGTTFVRGLMWTGIALIAFVITTAFDYKWLKTFAWPLYAHPDRPAPDDARDRAWRRRRVALDLRRPVRLPVQRAREDPDDRRPRELPGRPPGPARLAAVDPRRLRPRGSAVAPRHAPARPRARRSSCSRSSPACSSCRAPACAGWARMAALVLASLPFVWTYVLRDYQKQRLTAFLDPATDPQGAGYQLVQSQIAVGSGGVAGQGPDERLAEPAELPAGPGERLRGRDLSRGARLHRRDDPAGPVRGAPLAAAGRRAGARRTRSG